MNVTDKFTKFYKFITSTVVIYCALGLVLIYVGQVSLFYDQFPKQLTKESSIYPIIKLIGATLLGSGVFTAIIKSSEYTEVFQKVIENIISSKEFIAKRTDIKEYWSMVSKLMYEEKFPLISEDLQDVIANHYLPTTSDFYVDDFDVFVNIKNVDDNFWEHSETLKLTIRPSKPSSKVNYSLKTSIPLPPPDIADRTSHIIEEVTVNGVSLPKIPESYLKDNNLVMELNMLLEDKDEYHVFIKQAKTLCKRTNRDKKYFASYIINNMTITLLLPKDAGTDVEINNMGTVNKFQLEKDETNQGVRIISWKYSGLILPFQGYYLLFKQ